jgi:hypothetical protein
MGGAQLGFAATSGGLVVAVHITEGRHPGWGTNCGAGGAIDEGADQQTQVLVIKPNLQ